MRWYEIGLVALGLVGALSVLVLAPKTWMRWVFVVGAGLVLWRHLNTEGAHWQMLPAYVGLSLVLVVQFARLGDREGGVELKIGAWLAIVLCCLSVGISWVLPMFQLPKPTGPYAVGTYSGEAVDHERADDGVSKPEWRRWAEDYGNWREIPYRMWFPVEANTGTGRARYTDALEVKRLFSYKAQIRTNSMEDAVPVRGHTFPVVIFGPMWGGTRVQDTFLAEELASHGYVVVAVDHPLNGALVKTNEALVKSDRAGAVTVGPGSSAAGIEAVWAKELKIWVADDEAVLNELEAANKPGEGHEGGGTAFWPALDMDRVGALGHSFGGASSMALLGLDPRVKCAVNLDGWTFQGLEHRTTQPVLFVYEGDGIVRTAPVGVEAELDTFDNAAVDGSLAKYGGLRAFVQGTQHLDFTDQTLVSPLQRLTFTGPIKGDRVRTILRGMVVGFFDEELKGVGGGVPAYPEVKVERFGGQ